jgi:hypothetical protein
MPATPPATRPLRLAKRRTEIDRLDQIGDAGLVAGGGVDHPLAGLDQDGEALDRLEGVGEAAARGGGATFLCAAGLAAADRGHARLDVLGGKVGCSGGGGCHAPLIGSGGRMV